MSDDQTTTTDQELPYGGTVADLRLMIARHAQRGEALFQRMLGDVPDGEEPKVTGALAGEELEQAQAAHHAALYGWSLAAVLRWISETHGPAAAYAAASVVQDLGQNGGDDFIDDLPYLWAVHVQGPGDMLAASDQADARQRAAAINDLVGELKQRFDSPPDEVWPHAVVMPWDGTPDEHAASLARQSADGWVYTP